MVFLVTEPQILLSKTLLVHTVGINNGYAPLDRVLFGARAGSCVSLNTQSLISGIVDVPDKGSLREFFIQLKRRS